MSSSVKKHIDQTRREIRILKAKLAEIHRQDKIELLEEKLQELYELEMENENELKALDMTAREEEALLEMMEAAHVEVVHVDEEVKHAKTVKFSANEEKKDEEGGNSVVIRRPLPSVINKAEEETPTKKKKRFSWTFGRAFEEGAKSKSDKSSKPPRKESKNEEGRTLRRANSASFGENLLKKLPLRKKTLSAENSEENEYGPGIGELPPRNNSIQGRVPKEYSSKIQNKKRRSIQKEPRRAPFGRSKSTSSLPRISSDDSGVAQDAVLTTSRQYHQNINRGNRKNQKNKNEMIKSNGRPVDRAYSSLADYYNADPTQQRRRSNGGRQVMHRSMSVDRQEFKPTPIPKRVDRLFDQIDTSGPVPPVAGKAKPLGNKKRSKNPVFPRPIPKVVGGTKTITSTARQPSNITDNTGESYELEDEREDEIRRMKMPEVFDREYSGLTGYTGHDEGEYDFNCGVADEEDALEPGGDSAFELVGSPRSSGVAGRQRSILSMDNVSEESSLFEGIP
mmetsp:Transcript_10311/g.28459  ORF Transcript_10311/g.28459 Transcript_10311/m.28459 type:complete len:509 (+) Transcript_10311:112-1638(+)